jgi:NAD(P)-dependent dehydrogenase (short-subunit alcohol dehydrogenase family)
MTGKTIVITGASDGIGAAAARQLHARGAHVVLVGRSPTKTAAIAQELAAPSYLVDFADLGQVRELATKLADAHPRIDVLANNAGGIMGARELTANGFELTFQVNHLAPFLLTNLLLPTLIASRATVIQTSSLAARRYGRIDIDDLQNAAQYSPQKAYGDAKLENILFTRELDRRYRDQGIAAAAFHPGVVGTNFASETTHLMRHFYHTPVISTLFTISADKGATGLVWLAEHDPDASWQPGNYFQKNKVATTNRQADDAELARQLWDRSAAMVNL